MDGIDWRRLFPLLDELLELDEEARQARLAALEASEPALAGELRRLLAMERSNPAFLADPAVPALLQHPLSGRMIGPYRLEREIGEGGMGQVWLAERADGLYQRRVALKLLRPGFASADLQQRFAREQQILARLAHAHIARLLDAGISEGGQPYLALEYIEGEPITDYAQRLKLSVAERIGLILQVCDAVSHAHASLVVHRDLKPSNILVTPAGDVRLLDFGIAKLLDTEPRPGEITRADARAFTLHYAAPEQLRGEPVGTMTDVYALGAILFELLTGLRPYRAGDDSDAAWQTAILHDDAVRPSQAVLKPQALRAPRPPGPEPDPRLARELAGDLDNIILKALSKQPAQRYASIEALAQDLRRYLEGRPVLARPASLAYRTRKYLRRHGLAIGGGLAIVTLLAASLMVALWQARQALSQAARAQAMQDFVIGLFEADSLAGGQGMDLRGLLQIGVERASRELAGEPASQAAMLGLIARLHNNLGDHGEALEVLRMQAEALDRADGDAGAWLQWRIEQARALRGLGQVMECLRLFAAGPGAGPDIRARAPLLAAEYESQHGRCLRLNGRSDEARILFERALALRSRHGSPAEEAESLTDLAALSADAGRLDMAIAGMRQALGRLEASGSSIQPLAVGVWRSLSVLYRERGDVAAAEGAARQAAETAVAMHGRQHPLTAESLRQLGAILVDEGRLDEAEALVREAHATLSARFGEWHPDLGASHNSLGIIAYERGEFDDSERHLRRSVAIWAASPDPVRLPGALINLGRVLLAAGRPAEAEAQFERALALRRAQYGEEHAVVGAALRFLGEAQFAQGRVTEAEASLAEAVRLLREQYGPLHPQCGAAELALARVRWRLGQTAGARDLAEDVVVRFGGDDPEHRKLRWWARALAAESECATGERGVGSGRLRALLAELDGQGMNGSLRREIEAVQTACDGSA